MRENMEQVIQNLTDNKLSSFEINKIVHLLQQFEAHLPEACWQKFQDLFANSPTPFSIYPFNIQYFLYKMIYASWNSLPAPAWFPTKEEILNSNLDKLMKAKNFPDYQALHRWSIQQYPDFWQTMVQLLEISFDVPFKQVVSLDKGIEYPQWFVGSKLNIINSCFKANPQQIAIISQNEHGHITHTSYQELQLLSNQIANSLALHFSPGDKIAIIMPMTREAVAIYLGIIKAGCVAVSIADSFSAEEIAIRLKISGTIAVFTQEYFSREEKTIPLYDRVIKANPSRIIVLPENPNKLVDTPKIIRSQDMAWHDFLTENAEFTAVSCEPNTPINILFSSGTTGDPKAIPWNHTTPIKCSSDAYLHHNLQINDRFCWPTNLGWMMGPWLIFATLMNKATMMLYEGVPNGINFGKFIQDQKITHLGIVPTLVKTWRNSGCMESLDWSALKLFTSTGECSNEEDMLYLMALGRYRPVIEYCGGTEIGGAYITGTIIQPSAPAAFTTATLGLDFVIIDETNHISNKGEVALIPPSLGLSTELLNKNHHQVYYQDMPKIEAMILRRHGDEIEKYSNGYYRLHGRMDDTMNLSGIKVSSAEIERILNSHPKILETAAIAAEPTGGGPSQLIIYTVLKTINVNESIGTDKPNQINLDENIPDFKRQLQNMIKQQLNPLFKINDIVFINALPRTASNKVMRRVLRNDYEKKQDAAFQSDQNKT